MIDRLLREARERLASRLEPARAERHADRLRQCLDRGALLARLVGEQGVGVRGGGVTVSLGTWWNRPE